MWLAPHHVHYVCAFIDPLPWYQMAPSDAQGREHWSWSVSPKGLLAWAAQPIAHPWMGWPWMAYTTRKATMFRRGP